MSELRTRRRDRGRSRVRSVQGRLSMLYEDEDESGQSPAEPSSAPSSEHSASSEQTSQPTASPPPIFHPLAYRGVVANWPVEWRERWGRRANSLEEGGLSWRDAETQAFVEVWNQVRSHTAGQPASRRPHRAPSEIDSGSCRPSHRSIALEVDCVPHSRGSCEHQRARRRRVFALGRDPRRCDSSRTPRRSSP